MQRLVGITKSVLVGYLCFAAQVPVLAQESAAPTNAAIVVTGNEVVSAASITGASSLKVSPGATAVIDFSKTPTLNITGSIDNSGSIYAVSSDPSIQTVNFSALNISNHSGALLTTVLPTALASNTYVQNLSLSLNAINNILNAGTISSAGNLSMVAGNSITNTALTTAVQNIDIQAGIAGLLNSGTISSITGNLNISNIASQNLLINNTNGTLQALLGSVNIGANTAGILKPNLTISGGDVISKELNVITQGIANVSIEQLTGVLNVTACDLHVNTNTADLQLGLMNVTGDPTYYNPGGQINITTSITASGSNLAFIAGTNIVSAANNITISTSSSTFSGGNILMVAGANITTSGGTGSTATQAANPPDTAVTINGGLAAGGYIDLTGGGTNNVSAINAQGGSNYSGGSVTLIAYGGTGTNAGTITLPVSSTISTGTAAPTNGGTPVNGNVLVIAGATSGNAITLGSINTSGVTNNGVINNGVVNILSATPLMLQSPNGKAPDAINSLVGQSYVGQTFVQVSDTTGISAGSAYILNSTGANSEIIQVASVQGTTLNLSVGLLQNHFASENVMMSAPQLVTFNSFAGPVFQNAGAYGGISSLQGGNITTGAITAGANVVIGTTGNVNLNGSITLNQNPPSTTSYNNTPVVQVTGNQINIPTGVTISSAISNCSFCQDQLNLYTSNLTNSGKISGSSVNVQNFASSILAVVNNGTISGINPGSTAGNPWVNVQSAGGISFAGAGNITVPSLAVISINAADNNSITFTSNTLFSTGTGGLVTLSAQGSNGSIVLNDSVSLVCSPTKSGAGGPLISMSSPTITLANGSTISGLESSMIFTSGALTQSPQPLTFLVPAGSSSQIIGSSTGQIILRPTDGQNINFSAGGAGASLTVQHSPIYLFTGTNRSSGIAGIITIDPNITVTAPSNFQAVDPNGGINGIAFQPYVGLATNFNANPKQYTLAQDYTYAQILLLMAPIAQTGLFQNLGTYSQGAFVAPGATNPALKSSYAIIGANKYTIQAAKQMGFQVTAGAYVANADHSVNVQPTEFEIDYALQQAIRYGNVMDIVVGNECIVGGTAPLASTTNLIQAMNYGQVTRNAMGMTATTLPITTRQTYGVLSGVTLYQSTVDLLNGCTNCQATYGLIGNNFEGTNGHVYADVYPYYDGTNADGTVASNSIASYLVPNGTQTTTRTSISQSDFKTLVTAAGVPVLPNSPPAPPPIVVGIQADLNGTLTAFQGKSIIPQLWVAESGWATASTQSNNTQTTSLPDNAPQALPQWSSWYYADAQLWSYNNKTTYNLSYQIPINGYFEAYDEPNKFSASQWQGGEPNFGVWTATGTTTTPSTNPASAVEQFQLTGIVQKFALPVLHQSAGPLGLTTQSVQLNSLDLTNPANLANIVGLQRTGDIGGSLALANNNVLGGVLGGTVYVSAANLPASLSSLNIPANTVVVVNKLTAGTPINVNITANSTSNQVVINGILNFTGAGTSPIMNITSNQNATVLAIGPQAYVSSTGGLAITGNGSMVINAPLVTASNLSITTSAGVGPGHINVNNFLLLAGSGTIAISAAGDLSTRALYGGTVGAVNNITLQAGGSYTLQAFNSVQTMNDITVTTGGSQTFNGSVLSLGAGNITSNAGGDINSSGLFFAGNGKISLTAGQNVDLKGSVLASGDVSLAATTGTLSTGLFQVIQSTTGNINLTSTGTLTLNSQIFAGNNVSATSKNGNVSINQGLLAGKGATVISAGLLTSALQGYVYALNGSVQLTASSSIDLSGSVYSIRGGNVDISASGSGNNVASVYVGQGSLNVSTLAGTLTVKPFSSLLAFGPTANIALLNIGLTVNDKIVLGQFSSVQAYAFTSGNGNVTISAGAGPLPAQIPGNAPTNVISIKTGTGQIFFGTPRGPMPSITATGSPSLLIAKSANITFQIAGPHAAGNQAILLSSGNLIIADPPSGTLSPQFSSLTSSGYAPALVAPTNDVQAGSRYTWAGLSRMPYLSNLTTLQQPDTVNHKISAPPETTSTVFTEDKSQRDDCREPLTPIAYAPPLSGHLKMNRLRVQSSSSMHVRQSGSASITFKENHLDVASGDVLITATKKSTVTTGNCVVELGPGAIVLLTQEEGVTKVRNLHDNNNDDVQVIKDGRRVYVTTGEEILAGPDDHSVKHALVKDKIARRKTRTDDRQPGLISSEVSIPHLLQTNNVLSELYRSKTSSDRAVIEKVLKMAAVIQHVTAHRGPYQSSEKQPPGN